MTKKTGLGAEEIEKIKKAMASGQMVEVRYDGSSDGLSDLSLSATVDQEKMKKTWAYVVSLAGDFAIIAFEDCVDSAQAKKVHVPYRCEVRLKTEHLALVKIYEAAT